VQQALSVTVKSLSVTSRCGTWAAERKYTVSVTVCTSFLRFLHNTHFLCPLFSASLYEKQLQKIFQKRMFCRPSRFQDQSKKVDVEAVDNVPTSVVRLVTHRLSCRRLDRLHIHCNCSPMETTRILSFD
jgi:hypothetical protein